MSGVRLLDYWSPPDGAGAAVACLATSFTFEADFFMEDCVARFLRLSTVSSETTDRISSIAALLEEEDRLSEAQVTVLVDRSSPAEKRNLRWDVLPIAVRGGLLHAKVAALLWERSARIIVGSANLTAAGYRRQVEVGLAIDLDEDCTVPQPVLDELIVELRRLTDLAPGAAEGAKGRALSTIDALAARVGGLGLPRKSGTNPIVAVAPARPGVSPLDRLDDVWRGVHPLWATVLSPFWDDVAPAPVIEAVRQRLTGRPASLRELQLIVAIDPYNGNIHAPPSLAQAGAEIAVFDPPDDERRGVHAKVLLFESDEWIAAMIGSSNATRAGYGLDNHFGHYELNVWVGCSAQSSIAKSLRSLVRLGEPIDVDDEEWQPVLDEDEPTTPVLPLGFVLCTIDAGVPPAANLELDPGELPARWTVKLPGGAGLLDSTSWRAAGAPTAWRGQLPDGALPAFLEVHWSTEEGDSQASWPANVADRSALPAPAELKELPVDVLLNALASTRPLPVALEHELRRRQRDGEMQRIDLDPLRRFDDRGLLLQRSRHISLALWRLKDRLGRPTSSVDALVWRLSGAFGPLAIADALVSQANDPQRVPGEAHFLLAELALTVDRVDWTGVPVGGLSLKDVKALVAEVLEQIAVRANALPDPPDAALGDYVAEALKAVRR
jgi:hypothetical protein